MSAADQGQRDSDGNAFAESKRREARLLEQRAKAKEDDPLADQHELHSRVQGNRGALAGPLPVDSVVRFKYFLVNPL